MNRVFRAALRPIRKPRKWIAKKVRPAKIYWNDSLLPKWHERTFGGWLYVDETGNFQGTSDPFYMGATGVFIPKKRQGDFNLCCQSYRDALNVFGVDRNVEIHAVDWIHNGTGFPPKSHVDVRAHWLRRFMSSCSQCPGLVVINVIADSMIPRSVVGNTTPNPSQLANQMRRDVFAHLFSEFESVLVSQNLKGHALVDENQIGSLRELHNSMKKELERQPLAPIGIKSESHHGVQLADVCAYFMLQQLRPNSAMDEVHSRDGLNDIARCCPDSVDPSLARVHYV